MRSLLNIPRLYTLFQSFVRGSRFYEAYIHEYLRPWDGCRILDIGCGPGDLLAHLPEGARYVGLDANARYIRNARRKYGQAGEFICHPVKGHQPLAPHAFDIVVGTGVLHHLDDEEALQFFELARASLRPGGRLVTVDGCRAPGLPLLARVLLRLDRGPHIRDHDGYRNLALGAFPGVATSLRRDMFAFPYCCLVMECQG